jgi:hypothetical protein
MGRSGIELPKENTNLYRCGGASGKPCEDCECSERRVKVDLSNKPMPEMLPFQGGDEYQSIISTRIVFTTLAMVASFWSGFFLSMWLFVW